ncbi:glycosyltransferase [Caloramator sp. mosi_1]|uniref:glycosyltransferase n=1 Tax=Caloramator sp. mosi_1 TaxID=3023090 RepID=UPI00236130D8|nr:glycosyltransferase [Caloramator sp. mosi_1]WDC84199.1 glycosyltransferase [Caloramator sp. mosi_1]
MFNRNPLNKNNITAYKKIKEIIRNGKYDIIHCHTPVASFLTRLACRKVEYTKVIYTAHGFHFFKGAPLKNWLIYYPIEKWLSKYTDSLITINDEDYNCAITKGFKAKKFTR